MTDHLRRLSHVIVAVTMGFCAVTAARPAQAQDTTRVSMQDSTGMQADSLDLAFGMMDEFMGPMMGRMAEAMLDRTLTILSRPETAERLATFTRNYFEALVRHGFSEEQALRLTAAVGFPMVGGAGGG